MIKLSEEEVDFLRQFKGSDLERLCERAQKEFYANCVYRNEQEGILIYSGAARFVDLLLGYIQGTAK